MLHMIRQIMGDSAFRGMLRGLQKTFYHQTVTTQQVEEYMSQYAHRDLSKIFEQYLRTTRIPVLSYQSNGDIISYRWGNCVKGFNMPVKVYVGGQAEKWITPTDDWQTMRSGTDGQLLGTSAQNVPRPANTAQPTGGRPNPRGPGPGILVVGETAIVPASFPATQKLLRRMGFEVISLDVSELQKAEAGVTCCSILFDAPAGDLSRKIR